MKIKDIPELTIKHSDGKKHLIMSKQIFLESSKKKFDENSVLSDQLPYRYQQFLQKLIDLGLYKNKPLPLIKVTSANRDYIPKGGAKQSKHLKGEALDFVGLSTNLVNEIVTKNPKDFGDIIGGIGIYNNHIHFDVSSETPLGVYAPHFRYWNATTKMDEDQKKMIPNKKTV